MNPNKAFRKFALAVAHAPEGAHLTVGLCWIEKKGWRVVMAVGTAMLNVGTADARGLADKYDKQHQEPEYRGRETGLEWVAGDLRKLADEADEKNREGVIPPEMLDLIPTSGTA